jgi:hypothetical protein
MTRSPKFGFSFLVVALMVFGASRAYADAAQDRAVISDTLDKLGGAAHSLSKTAQGSDDRGARKKFASAATDLGDDLQGLARRAGKPDVAFEVVLKGLAEIDKDAAGLVDTADEIGDKQERKNLRAQAVQLQQQIGAARKIIEAYAAKKGGDDKPAQAKNAPMADDSFNGLMGAVRGATYDNNKVGVIADAARNNWFTAKQIAALMGLLTYDGGKIEAAVAAWPKCVDKGNSFELFPKLTYDSSREQLRSRLR